MDGSESITASPIGVAGKWVKFQWFGWEDGDL